MSATFVVWLKLKIESKKLATGFFFRIFRMDLNKKNVLKECHLKKTSLSFIVQIHCVQIKVFLPWNFFLIYLSFSFFLFLFLSKKNKSAIMRNWNKKLRIFKKNIILYLKLLGNKYFFRILTFCRSKITSIHVDV